MPPVSPASLSRGTEEPFAARLAALAGRPRARGRRRQIDGVLRFAFYGRMSTADYQDAYSSQQWQRDSADRLIAGHGRIVASFFDLGVSRSVPWQHRPRAAALLKAIVRPDRAFDAIVIGEYERAFCGSQLRRLLPLLLEHQVQVWLPEAGGPIDPENPAHQALLMLLGHQAEREVLRCRFRTTAAMRVQAREQGRHLGGRPPYGYRLVDAGPHPNAAHARWGRRLHRLDPDPATADQVRWIFARRLEGWSTAAIARTLNAMGVVTPSGHDRARNPHRAGTAWCLRTIAEILANPRYTGRQVWNRHGVNHHEREPGNKAPRPDARRPTHHGNPRQLWEFSRRLAHPPLVSEADFLAVQQISAVAQPDDGNTCRYQLTGLVICGLCGRRMEGHWAHGRARYRCRHGHTSASDADPDRAKVLYVREDLALEQVKSQYGHALGCDITKMRSETIAEQLRQRGSTIVCTAVSITLATGAASEDVTARLHRASPS